MKDPYTEGAVVVFSLCIILSDLSKNKNPSSDNDNG